MKDKCVLIQNYNQSMRNESGINDLMPWQTQQGWDSPNNSHKNLFIRSPNKKSQPTIHSRADSKNKQFFKTKRNTSFAQTSHKIPIQPKRKVSKPKQKINFLNVQLNQVAYATVMKNWAQKTVNTCPIKVAKVYNQIFEETKSALKKIDYYKQICKKIGGDGLQNFTNHQIQTRNIKKDNFKVSFSQFLEMRRKNQNKINVTRKTVTEPIQSQPAIHVKVPNSLNSINKSNFLRQNQVQNHHKSSSNVMARRKLIVSTLKCRIRNSKMFQQFQLNITKCQDLKKFSLSNLD